MSKIIRTGQPDRYMFTFMNLKIEEDKEYSFTTSSNEVGILKIGTISKSACFQGEHYHYLERYILVKIEGLGAFAIDICEVDFKRITLMINK